MQAAMAALPAIGASAPSWLPTAMQGIQAVQSFHDTFGPQGSLAKGDIMGAAKGASGLMNQFSSAPSSSEPTTMSLFGLSPDKFATIPADVKQELLRKVMGR